MDYKVYKLSKEEWIKYGLIGIGLAGVIAYVFYKSIVVFIILSPLAYLYPKYKKNDLKLKRDRKLAGEFREGIQTLSSSLSAGFSFENAMKESESEIKLLYGEGSMIAGEFSYINHRVSMNIPIEKAWEEFAQRTDSEDIRNFARVVKVAKRSGGELNSIIAHSADTLGDKIKIDEEIKTMTAAKRLEQSIMNVIPVGIILYIDLSSPGFFDTLYTTLMGRIVMTGCLAVYVIAILISKKVLNIEV